MASRRRPEDSFARRRARRGQGTLDVAGLHTLGQIGEALLATGSAWQIRRLTAATGDRNLADRATLKRHIDELVAEPARVAVLVVLGSIIDIGTGPALVTGAQAKQYPEDSSLPLAWIRERLRTAMAEQVVVALSATGDGEAASWFESLATHRPQQLIVVDSPPAGHRVADVLLTGLCGDALDHRTGTVTMASLSDYIAQLATVAQIQRSTASETVAQPPPLGGMWDVRRSQLATRLAQPRKAGPVDLTGSVLPGRFRIDRLVARGTFGAVYRARQLAVERDVAVKVLHEDIDPSSEDGKLFVHEIRSVGRIDHTNVVRIHQADVTLDGQLFFAMELLGGHDLQELGGRGPMARARAIDLARQLLEGLGAAHDAGLVHADVKPANAIVVEAANASANATTERLVLVDFGLARLRSPDRAAESAGGTPAYMAPEQLHEGRVDARSDLYSAALVLVFLLTGWRRPNARTLSPPLDTIDADLRLVLARALDADPAKRYQTARELAAALTGVAAPAMMVTQPTPVLPFRHLAPLTEHDRGRLYGREQDLAVLIEHVLYQRSVIYTAPSGTGKTSLLRAGLLPRLELLGVQSVYVRCRANFAAELATKISPGKSSIAEAITTWHTQRGGKLVIVLDQLETSLADADFVPALLAFDQWPRDADVTVLLAIREDYLARLVARTQELEPGIPVVRLTPLSPEGARAAILGPLTEARLAIEPELLDVLLADLQTAATAIGPEMGWGRVRAVFPPHLQLACSVLYEALGPGEATLALAHYRRLGGFDAIVGEHLDRVIDVELADGRDVIARDVFVSLVTTANERAVRPEAELIAMVGKQHDPTLVADVLEILRSRGLLVRVRGADDGEPSWELVHDSLVPRVLAWIDRRDLARRRAVELVRYHLRRSRPDAPSLLGRAELREIAAHSAALAELDVELKSRGADTTGWTPSRLVARSRQTHRRTQVTLATFFSLASVITGIALYRNYRANEHAREEASLRDRDLGRFTLSLELFDWDPVALRATTVLPVKDLQWQLHAPDDTDLDQFGKPYSSSWLVRGTPRVEGTWLVEHVEAHGGRAFLSVDRGTCSPSVVPLRQVPGYASRRDNTLTLKVRVPTCSATRAGMAEIPAGLVIDRGVGEPPSAEIAKAEPEYRIERRLNLPRFWIDRTEATNAEFQTFASMSSLTGIATPNIPHTPRLLHVGEARKPIVGIDWFEARAFCQYLGKRLPTSPEWVKAMRGGVHLAGGALNPMPRRNLPWGLWIEPIPAHIGATEGKGDPTREVGASPGDVSPYGVMDLAGNVAEWTDSLGNKGSRIVRGGNWSETTPETLVDFIAIENPRQEPYRQFSLGVRCVSE
ncbi:MAG: bifunctional serine/threonine-protein kinase/formylglycine-generating enzyme family protein [Kofleriaceae bacterium]